jgi:hypothetical protein
MKNIHIIPTDKPSRLFRDSFGKLLYSINIDQEQKHFAPQHLYITSDEEINEGNWFYDLDTKYVKIKQSWENSHLNFNGKKIILTTDQDLIKEGVQAIDDEFLEWFVKNPSCEYVEVSEDYFKPSNMVYGHDTEPYKIIIPKEEQKQHLIDMMRNDEELGLYDETEHLLSTQANKERLLEDVKEETLREAAERYRFGNTYDNFIRGAEWQEKRMYSEEEVIDLLQEMNDYPTIFEGRIDIKEWFEQLKKK